MCANTNTLVEQLPQIRMFVNNALFQRRKEYPADEIINEAYVKMYDNGQDYDPGCFRKICMGVILEYSSKRNTATYSDNGSADFGFENRGDEKFCKKCNNPHPVSYFNVLKQTASDYKTYQSICKGCVIKKVREWDKSNPDKVTERNKKHKAKLKEQRALKKKLKPKILSIKQQMRHKDLYEKIRVLKIQYSK